MTDNEAERMAERYGVSWYADIDHVDAVRICPKDRLPVARTAALADVVGCMRENVEEAVWNRDGVRKRYEDAQRDGLFDLEALETVRSRDIRETWLAAIEVQKGDRGRCVAELKHWRQYLGLALKGELPTQKKSAELWPATPPATDRRLPPEREDVA